MASSEGIFGREGNLQITGYHYITDILEKTQATRVGSFEIVQVLWGQENIVS